MKSNKKQLAIIFLIIILIAAIDIFYAVKYFGSKKDAKLQQTQSEVLNIENQSEPAGIANPASQYCGEQGGNSVIKTKDDGSQYGLCYFDDNRACEEWAMMRGECPVGGVKTTGYDTEAQRFCAWSGGATYAVENAVCTFGDGSTCLADDFYNGNCGEGQNVAE